MKDKTPPAVVHPSDLERNEKDPFRRDHVVGDVQPAPLDGNGNPLVAPPAPTTETEIAEREKEARSIADVKRVDYSDPPEGDKKPVVAKAPNSFAVSHIPGTEIVVGGPTQQ